MTAHCEIVLALAQANAFIRPIGSGWYRHHPLFGEVLRLKLQRERPDRVADPSHVLLRAGRLLRDMAARRLRGPVMRDAAAGPDGVQRLPGQPVLVETKLHPPPVHDETIPRQRLQERLRDAPRLRLSLVACPAGFGKTTLLAAWREAEAINRPVAWLSLDDGDNDPVVLWAHVIEALGRACPDLGQSVSRELAGAAPISDVVLPRLVNELAGRDAVTLILDDFHRLSDGAARDSVAWFVDHVPPAFQLMLSTRTEPPLRLAALRANGELFELRADDLRFTAREAGALLNGRLGLGLAPEDVDRLVERTQGWPAGLYLAALSLRGSADRHAAVRAFGASSRPVADYLVTEVLDAHDPPVQALMLRSSILERLCGPLCDAVAEQQNSRAMLDALSRTNLFLVPLDGDGRWYRFHSLFAQLLRVELEDREPGVAPALHRRAYAWHRDHGATSEAIQHAIEGGAYADAAELIEASWASYLNTCRYASVLAWIRRFPEEILSGDVRLLLVEAWALSLSAQREQAARAIAAAEQLGETGAGPLPDGFSSVEASLTALRACFPWGDVGAQLEHGRRAAKLEGPGSPWRPILCWAVGLGLYFSGESGKADQWFAESAALAPPPRQWAAAAASLAYRSLIAGEHGHPEDQRLLAEQAAALAREHGTKALTGAVPVALGVSLAAQGRPQEALPLIEQGIGVFRATGQPTLVADALLYQAQVLRTLGERERSDAAIAEARAMVRSCPDPGILTDRLTAVDRPPRARAGSGDQELTPAELRVLKLLNSDLSERQIGRELYVSHNTVHGHVRSIYRKLGASSRAGSLKRARELGLL
jgi:LuxR family transcriptional regulator, maltose regulon positive regulatory protein